MSVPRLYTVDEAAGALNLSRAVVYALCASRKIGHARMGTGRGRIMIPEPALSAYLAACEVPAEEAKESPAALVGPQGRRSGAVKRPANAAALVEKWLPGC